MGICNAKGKLKEPKLRTREGFLNEEVALQFKIDISKFKGKNLIDNNTYITIKFGDRKEYKSDKIYENYNPNYSINDSFIYSTTNFDLVEQYLTITLYGGPKDKKLGFCKVNLYKIATGAIHNNFTLISSSGSPGRISFNVKMSQYFNMIIKSCV